jgi:hypothetical protein
MGGAGGRDGGDDGELRFGRLGAGGWIGFSGDEAK